MQNLTAAPVSFFAVELLRAEIAEKLAGVRAPEVLIAGVTVCAGTAVLAVVSAPCEPWWAASSGAAVGAAR
jgi:hypothetical protein